MRGDGGGEGCRRCSCCVLSWWWGGFECVQSPTAMSVPCSSVQHVQHAPQACRISPLILLSHPSAGRCALSCVLTGPLAADRRAIG